MTGRYRGRHRGWSLRAPLTVLLALLVIIGVVLPGAYGGYIARVTNNANSAATATYFTCTNAAQGPGAANTYFAYPFGDANGVLGASDISGNLLRGGAYTAAGVTYGNANGGVCPRDNRTVITLNGSSGYVSGPVGQITGPNTFSLEVWFKTTAKQGKLIGFGDLRTGSSNSYDRHLYINTSGNLVFGVFPSVVRTIATPSPVTDGNWHQAVATLSSAGMVLYLDGAQVAADPATTSAQPFSGYWRIGYDTLNSGWTGSSTNYYFNGSLAFTSAYSVALTAAQVQAHYVAGR